jgi:hypothetical protein
VLHDTDVPKAPTARAKLARDAAIAHDRARGWTWQSIAARHQVSARMAQKVWREALDRSWVEEPADPADALAEMLAQVDALVEDFAELAETTRNDSVKLGALKMRLNAIATKLGLMRMCGVLPREIHWLSHEVDTEATRRAILSVFERHQLPERAIHELQEAFAHGFRQKVANLRFAQTGVATLPAAGGNGLTPAKRDTLDHPAGPETG